MKARTIKALLKKKTDAWLASIAVNDKALAAFLKDQVIITGGAIPTMLMNEKPNDYDVYLRSKEAVKRVAEYYVGQFCTDTPSRFKDSGAVGISVIDRPDRVCIKIRSAGVAGEKAQDSYEYFELNPDQDAAVDFVVKAVTESKESVKDEKGTYKPVFLSGNAITLSDQMQIVIRFYGEPDEIHKNFDFVHCMSYWRSDTGELYLPSESLQAIMAKELVYNGSLYPIATLLRLRKFYARGWTCHAGHILKLAFQVNELDLNDFRTLEDQLIGVDVAYFQELLDHVSAERIKNPDKKIDGIYIAEVIDKMF